MSRTLRAAGRLPLTATDMEALHAAWLRGELKAEGLEAVARVILGLDEGTPRALTAAEREYMVADAYHCSPDYPREFAPPTDAGLCQWWLDAMHDYVSDMF